MATVPLATYRLQFGSDLGFRDAQQIVPYLRDLGVSHVYASPYLRARTGSTHGYDVVDHGSLHPEIGDEASFAAFAAVLQRHGMGQILDFVPNHVGVAGADNAWWLDVLEYGRDSPFAGFFDIDWQPAKAELRGKLLLPFLGDQYGRVLERGELYLAFDGETGSLSVRYGDHRFPITPRHYARILGSRLERLDARLPATHPAGVELRRLIRAFGELPTPSAPARARAQLRDRASAAKRELAQLTGREPEVSRYLAELLRELNGKPGDPRSFRGLHSLLQAQHYRLAYWRVAADEINYRRFFDVNELAGLRVEREEVFEAIHQLVFRWIEAGQLQGLRIDHVDGLLDPRGYCQRLRARSPAPVYLVVEKILGRDERLRSDWPVDGTTGYEFLNLLNGLFVDPRGERTLDRAYRTFLGESRTFDQVLYASKKHVMNFLLGGELQTLAHQLDRLSEADWRSRDFTLVSLKEALKEVVAAFPVYRTYRDRAGLGAEDLHCIESAVEGGRRTSSDPERSLFDWIHAVLVAPPAEQLAPLPRRRAAERLAMRLQQYTAPVMAKALEDTSFYRYFRLVSLNEVGGDPRRFGVSVDEFHAANRERGERWPNSMLATATHDTKRGEDVRARIDVLSEIPEEWEAHVRTWARRNRGLKREIRGRPVPVGNDEYLLYQTLVGSWPHQEGQPILSDPERFGSYRERIEAYLVKAVREGKETSSWRHPNAEYEEALVSFVRGLLDPSPTNPFLADFLPFQARVAQAGALNGLAQLVLKLTVPGVPDLYQGCELWDLTLVDPDNRAPVDFEERRLMLEELEREFGTRAEPMRGDLGSLLRAWPDGRLKLLVTWRLLRFRASHGERILRGRYQPLAARGERAGNVCGFARAHREESLVVVAPRLCARLPREASPFPLGRSAWGESQLIVSPDPETNTYRDVITGHLVRVRRCEERSELALAELFEKLPLAALVPVAGAPGPT